MLKLAGEHKPTLLTLAALITFPEWTKETHHGSNGNFYIGRFLFDVPKRPGRWNRLYIYVYTCIQCLLSLHESSQTTNQLDNFSNLTTIVFKKYRQIGSMPAKERERDMGVGKCP